MSSRLLACILLLLASANWAAAQSCCPVTGVCGPKPADLPVNTTNDCVDNIQVGQIVIVGNDRTPQNVILRQIPFSPGQIISDADLRKAEANLARINLFDDGSMVEVLDPDGVVPVKDILVTVYEKCGAFRCGLGDDDEDEESPKAKCGCDDCSCCGCMNKPGAECSCTGECKCCGCKTVDTNSAKACVSQFSVGWLVFCDKGDEGCDSDNEGCKCDKSKCGRHVVIEEAGVQVEYDLSDSEPSCCDKEKCKCEKGKCKCCDKEDGSDCASGKCEKGKCACDCSKGKCCCDGKCCEDGKCCCEKKTSACCPFCPHSMNGCSMTWQVMEEICPALRFCSMCPWMQAQVQGVLKPCWKCFVGQCKQMIKDAKAAKATPCPGEEDASEEADGPQAKKGCQGCGGCADASKTDRGWHVRVFPGGKVLIRFKCGETAKQQSKDEECPCDTEKATEKANEPAQTVCPYLQKKQQEAKEKAVSAKDLYEQLGTPLENLAKLEKAQHLCKKGQYFCEAGEYDRAIKCFTKAKELCPGSHWEVKAAEGLQVAQAMKEMDEKVRAVTRDLMEKLLEQVIHKQAAATAEESEPAELPCQEPKAMREYKQKFSDLLDQAKSACATGDLEQARYLAQEAASLATPEVMEKVKSLLDGARDCFNSGCTADGWQMLNNALMLDPSCEEAHCLQYEMLSKPLSDRCNEYDSEPCNTLPTDDEDAQPCDKPESDDPCCDDGEEQEARFVIDVPEEDLDLVADDCQQCDETTPADLKEQVKQLMDLVRENISVDVDCGKSQPGCARLSVQIGGVEYQATFDANGRYFLRMKTTAPEVTHGDSEEAEEPMYMLETDLDPDW